jgi:PST family polysaccharide transporter
VSIIPLLMVLVPYLGVRATLSMTWPCAMALGRVRLLFWVSLIYALVHLPVFIAGTMLFGLPGAVWSLVAAGTLYISLNVWLLTTTAAVSPIEILRQLRRPVSASLAMVGVVAGAGWLMSSGPLTPGSTWTVLTVKILLGATVFCSTQYLLWLLEGRPPGIEHRLEQLLAPGP